MKHFLDIEAATSSTPKCTSTVPPKVTTNPPGGTTVAKNTIPTTTISDPCSGWVCHNGGTAVASDEDCACQCTKEWQGKRCEGTLFIIVFHLCVPELFTESLSYHLMGRNDILRSEAACHF